MERFQRSTGADPTRGTRLTISEIYPCILGESTRAGLPCVLVRLTGCNLRCRYCDSEFAFYGGTKRPVDEIVAEVIEHRHPLVLVTGGEPMLQDATPALIRRLIDVGLEVLVETSGSLDIRTIPDEARTILDIKCPDSGESHRMLWSNLDHLRPRDDVKFVVSSRQDYEWSRDILTRFRIREKATVLFSPAFGEVDPRELAEWILEDRLPVRLHLQIHKYIWEPEMRGV